jgi:hypothetical protein
VTSTVGGIGAGGVSKQGIDFTTTATFALTMTVEQKALAVRAREGDTQGTWDAGDEAEGAYPRDARRDERVTDGTGRAA